MLEFEGVLALDRHKEGIVIVILRLVQLEFQLVKQLLARSKVLLEHL